MIRYSAPHNPVRDTFGNCNPSSPLFEPDKHSDDVNEYDWENRNPGVESILSEFYDTNSN